MHSLSVVNGQKKSPIDGIMNADFLSLILAFFGKHACMNIFFKMRDSFTFQEGAFQNKKWCTVWKQQETFVPESILW